MLAGLYKRLRAYTLLTTSVLSAVLGLVLLVLALPAKLLGDRCYRICSTLILEWTVPAFLLPVTLAGARGRRGACARPPAHPRRRNGRTARRARADSRPHAADAAPAHAQG